MNYHKTCAYLTMENFCIPVIGVSLSTLSRSTVTINPDLPEAKKLKSW